MEDVKYLGIAITNQNSINEKIKKRLMSENACYHLVQKFLSSTLLSKNINTVFARVICALFFPPILAAEKSGCVKYADFFCGGLCLGFILVQLRIRYVLLIFYCNFVT